MAKEKITLTKEQNEEWKKYRAEIINYFVQSIDVPDDIRYFVEVGIARSLDQRFSTAEAKLRFMDAEPEDQKLTLDDLIPKGSEKQQLVRELLPKLPQFTEDMLKKLDTDQLKKLKENL